MIARASLWRGSVGLSRTRQGLNSGRVKLTWEPLSSVLRIVATNAFGMGIDKPDVRYVVHLDLTDNLEAYFQEAGRAGRDEKPSYAVMLYEKADIDQAISNFRSSFPDTATIKAIYNSLGNYFGIPAGTG